MQEERAETQLTLGKLIDLLQDLPKANCISGLGELHSYRGYYSDLAFEPTGKMRAVSDLLGECKAAMGEVFVGYKGGDFVMGRNTPLWVSGYGDASGLRLMGLDTESSDVIRPLCSPEED
jgi:hypothetical protein